VWLTRMLITTLFAQYTCLTNSCILYSSHFLSKQPVQPTKFINLDLALDRHAPQNYKHNKTKKIQMILLQNSNIPCSFLLCKANYIFWKPMHHRDTNIYFHVAVLLTIMLQRLGIRAALKFTMSQILNFTWQ
jgi:hypothetical protein